MDYPKISGYQANTGQLYSVLYCYVILIHTRIMRATPYLRPPWTGLVGLRIGAQIQNPPLLPVVGAIVTYATTCWSGNKLGRFNSRILVA